MDIRRIVHDFALASYHGAKGRPARVIPTAIRVARARFLYAIGPFAFSLYGLSEVPQSKWNDYLVRAAPFRRALLAASPREAHRLARNKVLFREHCLNVGLSDIPIICRIGGSPDSLGDVVELVSDATRFTAVLESAPARLFAKAIDGAHGAGAFVIARRDAGFEFDGLTGAATDLFAYLQQQCSAQTGFIIQPQVRPHARIRPLASPNGLPTARVVTANRRGKPEALYACLRIPVGTSVTDNFAHGTSGNLSAGIDLANGTLMAAHGSRCRNWPAMMRVDSHPDTGYRIADSQLPLWDEIVQTALRGQESLPDLMTIGWDVAATTDGVVLVEANSLYDMDILQVAHQRGLKSEIATKLGIEID